MANYERLRIDGIRSGGQPIVKTQHCPNCEATEQKLHDFRQEVSDAVEELRDTCYVVKPWRDRLAQFIIPMPKTDPLVYAMDKLEWCNTDALAKDLRDTLDALGFEIREKSDD